jgi:transcriptional antiterminator RfaH
MSNWYAVHTKPRSEQLARVHLERQGFECRLPRTRRALRDARGMRESIEPLFPRYLFLHADPACDNLATVRSTRGVSGLVRFGVEPALVPQRVIDALAARTRDDDGLVELDVPELTPGAQVRIAQGPFAGLDAVFQAHGAQQRVLLLLRVLGEACPVRVPLRHLAMHM